MIFEQGMPLQQINPHHKVYVQQSLSTFFVLVWFVAKMEHVMKSFARCALFTPTNV
jgi:hypothetical protein